MSACHLQNRIPYKKTNKTSYEKGHAPNLKYLKVWGVLLKPWSLNPGKEKLDQKTFDCMFIGYVNHSAAYIFLVLRNEVLDCNTVIETKNAEFFENIFPLSKKISYTPIVSNNTKNTNGVLRKSKQRFKKE